MQSCPNCGFERQPGGDECPKCGIVYEKYAEIVKHQKNQPKKPNRKSISRQNKIALVTVIAFMTLIIAFSIFNSIMSSIKIKRHEELKEKEQSKIIETFVKNSEDILSQVESLINRREFELARKEIEKFDIAILRESYPEIGALKQRIYDENNKFTMRPKSSPVRSLNVNGNGYDWNAGTYEDRISVCRHIARKFGKDYMWWFGYLNEFYDTTDRSILNMEIAVSVSMQKVLLDHYY